MPLFGLRTLAAALLGLTGCSTLGGDAEPGPRRINYDCNYGPRLTITYAGSTAVIESSDGVVTLDRRPSASGFWYQSATHSLRGSGNEISYTMRQMAPRLCQAS